MKKLVLMLGLCTLIAAPAFANEDAAAPAAEGTAAPAEHADHGGKAEHGKMKGKKGKKRGAKKAKTEGHAEGEAAPAEGAKTE
ncbi:MAG TPA: histone [Bdellovibrionota bacterium]|jgi:NADPH-dependent 2,4-dienoyl-CoA reductase/sulfur reductase-like enzyme